MIPGIYHFLMEYCAIIVDFIRYHLLPKSMALKQSTFFIYDYAILFRVVSCGLLVSNIHVLAGLLFFVYNYEIQSSG